MENRGAAPPRVRELARALERAGARTFMVGGWVRDRVARRLRGELGGGVEGEIDLEVYHLAAPRLAEELSRFGRVNLVGEAFAVYRVSPDPTKGDEAYPAHFDVSLPRKDSKVAPGHRGF